MSLVSILLPSSVLASVRPLNAESLNDRSPLPPPSKIRPTFFASVVVPPPPVSPPVSSPPPQAATTSPSARTRAPRRALRAARIACSPLQRSHQPRPISQPGVGRRLGRFCPTKSASVHVARPSSFRQPGA